MDIESVAADLYAVAPGDFIRERKLRSEAARRDGDEALAAAIGRLRRPTVSAALLNGLARQATEQLDELLSLGALLEDAQGRGSGDDLRELMRRRQDLTKQLLAEANGVAGGLGLKVTPAVAREIQTSLISALSDPQVADSIRGGRLAAAPGYAGLGDDDETASSPKPPREPARAKVVALEAKRAWKDAEERAEQRRASAAELDRIAREAQREVDRLDERITALEEDLRGAKDQRSAAHLHAASTRRAQAHAAKQAERADEQLSAAKAAYDRSKS